MGLYVVQLVDYKMVKDQDLYQSAASSISVDIMILIPKIQVWGLSFYPAILKFSALLLSSLVLKSHLSAWECGSITSLTVLIVFSFLTHTFF